MGRSKVGPSPSKWLFQDSTKAQAEFLPMSSPAVILGDFKVFMGGPFYALPPQSLDLHNFRSLHLPSTSAVYSHGHTKAITLLSLGYPLWHPKLWLFSDHPSHLSIPLTLICSLFILRFLSPILLIFTLHLLTSFPINSQSWGPQL